MTCFGEIATYCWESTTPTINKGDKNNKTGRQAATAKGEWGVVAHSCHLLWITSATDPNGTVWNVLIPQLPTDYHHFSTIFSKKGNRKDVVIQPLTLRGQSGWRDLWSLAWRMGTEGDLQVLCYSMLTIATWDAFLRTFSGWFNKTPSTKKDQPCRSTKNQK